MVKRVLIVLSLIGILSAEAVAQEFDAFARVSVSPREGVVRQPYRVTISVYTSTWYTKGLQFTNFQIENAFIIPFTRTLSSVNYINRKQYSTLSFYYLVFPYETGTLEIPALEIIATTPPEGDSKAQEITLRTQLQKIQVDAIPSSKDQEIWMVAKNVSFSENWDKPLDKLKVGDVVERKIILKANGTLPSFIEPLDIETPSGVSLYPSQPELNDSRTDEDVNGSRTEHYSYLFEQEGSIIIPEEVIIWWNPITRKVYQRIIPDRTLNIGPNPDLDLLVSLKDSLDALNAPNLPLEEKAPFPWKRYSLIGLLALLAGYILIRLLMGLIRSIYKLRKNYLQSEAHDFKQILHAVQNENTNDIIRLIYIWFDKARKVDQSAAVYDYLNPEDQHNWQNLVQHPDSALGTEQKNNLKSMLVSLRNQLLEYNSPVTDQSELNPG